MDVNDRQVIIRLLRDLMFAIENTIVGPAPDDITPYQNAVNHFHSLAAPIGIPAGAGAPVAFSDAEVPAGAINCANTIFTLANTPAGMSLQLFYNGVLQNAPVNYSLSGTTITTNFVPQTGDSLAAFYRY
jgi:hypothetical protein